MRTRIDIGTRGLGVGLSDQAPVSVELGYLKFGVQHDIQKQLYILQE